MNEVKSSYGQLLITGATGFLGQEIVRQAQLLGWQIFATGRSSREGLKGQNIRFRKLNLLDTSQHASLVEGNRVVVHAAGLAHQFGKILPDSSYFQMHVSVTRSLLQAAITSGIEHFILISSVSVYGVGHTCRDESSPCIPVGPYAESKWKAEQIAQEMVAGTSTKLTILRMPTIYGPGDPGNVSRLIHAIEQGKFVWIGQGENKKSLAYVEDAARACLQVVQSPSAEHVSVWNVSCSEFSMKEIVAAISKSLGKSPPRFFVPANLAERSAMLVSAVSFKRSKLRRIASTVKKWLQDDVYDSSRFRREYALAPKVSLATGILKQVSSRYAGHKDSLLGQQTQIENASLNRKRLFDFLLATAALVCLMIPMLLVAIAVKFTSQGPVFYVSRRVGSFSRIFYMPKFKTMKTTAPEVASHLLGDSLAWTTSIGLFLRKTSLDELPQLWSILRGDMSFVGPRPALYNQDDLVQLRSECGVDQLLPGLTGWAQVNGRDELSIAEKVQFDLYYMRQRSFFFDIKILLLTAIKVFRREGIVQTSDSSESGERQQQSRYVA